MHNIYILRTYLRQKFFHQLSILFVSCLLLISLILVQSKVYSQICPCDNYGPDTACGAINLSVSTQGVNLFCINNTVAISIDSTKGSIDSIYVCWGDNQYSALPGNFLGLVTHKYDYPADTCTACGKIFASIKICAVDTCALGYSYADFSTTITIRTNPNVGFYLLNDTICANEPFIIQTDTVCSNSCLIDSSEYTCVMGDSTFTGLAYQISPNTNTIFDPPIIPWQYANAGNYVVSLTMGNGCDTLTHTLPIHVRPPTFINPVISLSDSCAPAVGLTQLNGVAYDSVLWSAWLGFPNITLPTDSTPFITANDSGQYHIHVDAYGCCFPPAKCTWDTIFNLLPGPKFTLNAIPPICDSGYVNNFNSVFNPQGSITNYQWTFTGGNPATDTTANPPPVFYNTPGTHPVKLVVTSPCGTDSLSTSVVVNAHPELNITTNTLDGCDTLTVFVTNNSPSGQTYNWNAPGATYQNGTTNASANPILFYNTPSNYIFSVTASTAGCPDTTAYYNFTLNANPQLSSLANIPDSCLAFNLNLFNYFSLTPQPTDSGYLWTVIDTAGTIYLNDNSSNPATININTYTTYIVTVSAWNYCDSIVLTDTFTLIPPAIFSVPNDTVLCKYDPSLPLAILTNPPGIWTWNGTQITSFNPVAALQQQNYLVYIYGSGSCEQRDSFKVDVTGATLYAGNDTTLCSNGIIYNLNANIPGGVWSGNGVVNTITGAYNPGLAYPINDTVVYTFTDPNGCITPDTLMVNFFAPINSTFATIGLPCKGALLSFVNGIAGATATWDFGDASAQLTGDSVTHAYALTDTFTITMYLEDNISGCRDTVDTAIIISEPPNALFALLTDEGCTTLPDSVINQSTFFWNATYHWDFGNNDSSNLFNPVGTSYTALTGDTVTYTVTLTATNLCGNATYTDTVTVWPIPEVLFGVQLGDSCSPAPINFLNITEGGATNYWWYINDSLYSTAQVLSQQIFLADSLDSLYTVMLVASNQCGIDSGIQYVTIHPNNVQAFFNTDYTFGCVPLTVNFSSVASQTATVQWNFGDGNTGFGDTITHTFDSAGSYVVWQWTDNFCGFDSVSQTITVFDKPNSGFVVKPVNCGNEPVSFLDTTQFTLGNYWLYGDNSAPDSNLTTTTHSYTDTGLVTVQLITYSVGTGCRDTAKQVIQLLDYPHANLTFPKIDGCAPLTINFLSTSTQANYYQWSTGTGDTLNGANPSYNYLLAGQYTVTLTAIDSNGCKDDTAFSFINAYPVPEAIISATQQPPCSTPANLVLQDLSSNGGTSFWDLGQWGSSNQSNPVFAFNDTATVNIMLIASNIYLCADTAYDTIKVYPQVTADFGTSATEGCYPITISYTNLSTNATGYWWQFGDGNESYLENPTNTYFQGDTFQVMLVASIDSACYDTLKKDIIVFPDPQPIADFYASPNPANLMNPTIYFENFSQFGSTYYWWFEQGHTSTDFNTSYTYPAIPASYPVMLVVTNDYGCRDTVLKEVVINDSILFYVPNAFTPNDNNVNDGFTIFGVNIEHVEMTIYTRWGQPVYSSAGQLPTPWNGRYNNDGRLAPPGVYIYQFNITDKAQNKFERKGFVNLIR